MVNLRDQDFFQVSVSQLPVPYTDKFWPPPYFYAISGFSAKFSKIRFFKKNRYFLAPWTSILLENSQKHPWIQFREKQMTHTHARSHIQTRTCGLKIKANRFAGWVSIQAIESKRIQTFLVATTFYENKQLPKH